MTGREGGMVAGVSRDHFTARRTCWPDPSGALWDEEIEGMRCDA